MPGGGPTVEGLPRRPLLALARLGPAVLRRSNIVAPMWQELPVLGTCAIRTVAKSDTTVREPAAMSLSRGGQR